MERADRPVDDGVSADVLAVGLPALRPYSDDELEALDGLVSSGGRVLVIGVSGRRPGPTERQLGERLGLLPAAVEDGRPPLAPLPWRRWAGRVAALSPEGRPDLAELEVRSPRWVTPAPADARVLYRDQHGRGLVFEVARGQGSVVVLPADALANGRLDRPGNQDLLASLAAGLPGTWRFDEHRHGLVSAPAAGGGLGTFDLLLIHLAVAYLLGVAALARRFGPAWREDPAAVTSNRELLLGLGRLHHRFGHHREAAAALIERAGRFDPGLTGLDEPGVVDGPEALVTLAQRVAHRQRPSGTTHDGRSE